MPDAIRKKVNKDITYERLREVLDYNSETGIFTWKQCAAASPQWNARNSGKIAGTNLGASVQICIDKVKYKAHRLVWLYIYGKWPIGFLDHKDGNPFNNKISNLRPATVLENGWNRKISSNNTSGFKGVSYCKSRDNYEVRIKAGEIRRSLGRYKTPEEAHAAYCEAAKELHGEFARLK